MILSTLCAYTSAPCGRCWPRWNSANANRKTPMLPLLLPSFILFFCLSTTAPTYNDHGTWQFRSCPGENGKLRTAMMILIFSPSRTSAANATIASHETKRTIAYESTKLCVHIFRNFSHGCQPTPPVSIVGEMCIARFVYVGVCVCLCECENRSLLLSVDALDDARSNGIGNWGGGREFRSHSDQRGLILGCLFDRSALTERARQACFWVQAAGNTGIMMYYFEYVDGKFHINHRSHCSIAPPRPTHYSAVVIR